MKYAGGAPEAVRRRDSLKSPDLVQGHDFLVFLKVIKDMKNRHL
jgi:hypothetical protein